MARKRVLSAELFYDESAKLYSATLIFDSSIMPVSLQHALEHYASLREAIASAAHSRVREASETEAAFEAVIRKDLPKC